MLQALFVPVLVSAGFRLLGVARTQALLRHWASSGRSRTQPPESAHSNIQAVCRAQRIAKRRFGVGGTCLTRSFTLWALLLRRGLSTDVRVGFRRSEGKLEGHAWVEYEGHPLNESRAVNGEYSVFKEPAAFDAWQPPDCWR